MYSVQSVRYSQCYAMCHAILCYAMLCYAAYVPLIDAWKHNCLSKRRSTLLAFYKIHCISLSGEQDPRFDCGISCRQRLPSIGHPPGLFSSSTLFVLFCFVLFWLLGVPCDFCHLCRRPRRNSIPIDCTSNVRYYSTPTN